MKVARVFQQLKLISYYILVKSPSYTFIFGIIQIAAKEKWIFLTNFHFNFQNAVLFQTKWER